MNPKVKVRDKDIGTEKTGKGKNVIDPRLLEIKEYDGSGYLPLVDYGSWRVAVLRFIDNLLPQNIRTLQRHMETDEVFVLLEGKCLLFIGQGDEQVSRIFAQRLEPKKIYNVKKACWHTHVLSEDALLLIVENQDTGEHNSQELELKNQQRQYIIDMAAEYIL